MTKATAKDKKATPAKAKKEKVVIVRDVQNGVTRPSENTKTGIVWGIADKLSTNEAPANRADVLAATAKKEINPATAATQYGRWRKYHGLKGTGKIAATK